MNLAIPRATINQVTKLHPVSPSGGLEDTGAVTHNSGPPFAHPPQLNSRIHVAEQLQRVELS